MVRTDKTRHVRHTGYEYIGFNDKEMDSRPATTYELQGGGRMYPPVSREVSLAMYSTSNGYFWLFM